MLNVLALSCPRVVLDDSELAEIDGTLARHVSSLKKPPDPCQSTIMSFTNLNLDLKDSDKNSINQSRTEKGTKMKKDKRSSKSVDKMLKSESLSSERSMDFNDYRTEKERRREEAWEGQYFATDISPSSEGFKIERRNSDSDSETSPRTRKRSPQKRRTLGSSSGSDVALHEGAELSPLEDDQGTANSQLTL